MKRNPLILILPLLLLLSGCTLPAAAPEEHTYAFFAMDTFMELKAGAEESLLRDCAALVGDLEAELSVTRPDSALSQLNATGKATLSPAAAALLSRTLALSEKTDGALDPTIYPVVRAWGFTTGAFRVPSAAERLELAERVNYKVLRLKEGEVTLPTGYELDLGGVAKGYAGEVMADYLAAHGVTSAILNLGGNVQCLGAKPDGSPWRVAVRDPAGDGYLCVLSVEDAAVVTSGGYERYFEEDGMTYWHIMDPATAAPAHAGLASVTVVGSSGLVCDGLSTALFVMGTEKAAQFWRENGDFEAVFLTEDGQLLYTEGLEGRFTPMAQGYGTPEVIRHG